MMTLWFQPVLGPAGSTTLKLTDPRIGKFQPGIFTVLGPAGFSVVSFTSPRTGKY